MRLTELTALRNIGKAYERKLKSIDITTAEALKQIGSKEAFFKLKLRYPNVCLVHLYALEGAISDIEYNKLPEDVKQNLKIFSDNLK
jgi:DNA transformation protein